MCDMSYVSIGMQGFGAITGAMGAGEQASAAKAQAEMQSRSLLFQSQVARNNAQIAQWQAEDAIKRGQDEEVAFRLQAAGLKADQRVGYAASGIALDSDTVIRTMVSTDYMTEFDAATIRSNAARAAWGYQIQRNSYLDQAASLQYGADAYSAQADAIDPDKAVFSSLLGSVASMAPSLGGLGGLGGGGRQYGSLDELAAAKGFW